MTEVTKFGFQEGRFERPVSTYSRYSTEKQDEGSAHRQRDVAAAYAKIRAFEADGVSLEVIARLLAELSERDRS